MKEITEKDIVLADRSLVTNKGDAGRVLIIGGDKGMAGAPSFSAEAAYRCGAGLVEVSTHPDNRVIIQTLVPEAVWTEWQNACIKKADSIVIGVGLGKKSEAVRLLERVLTASKVPLVIDADAINIIAENLDLLTLLHENTVLTPHLGELSRLTGLDVKYISENPDKVALGFAKKYKTNIVAKSKVSYIALSNGDIYKNTRGSSALSKGGTGDVLTGIMAALIAGGVEMEKAIPEAVLIHAIAGERAGELYGERGALTRDIIKALTTVI